jgi:hypothetical protein
LFSFFRIGIWEETNDLGTERPFCQEQKSNSQESQYIIPPRSNNSESFSP